jgi:hypothetical protein
VHRSCLQENNSRHTRGRRHNISVFLKPSLLVRWISLLYHYSATINDLPRNSWFNFQGNIVKVCHVWTMCIVLLLSFYSWVGVRLSHLVLWLQMGLLGQPWMIDERIEPWWNYNWQGKTEVLGEKPTQVPLCPPQIHADCPGIELELGPPWWETDDWPVAWAMALLD